MDFLKFFSNEPEVEIKKYSSLFSVLQNEYPQMNEEGILITSCVAGLLARVAYVDFHLDVKEQEVMKDLLGQFHFIANIDPCIVAQIAIKHIKEMAGLENHLYVHPLKNLLSKDERYNIIQSLFLIAASDGSVEVVESEEIRLITKGFELSNQHFLAARAEVAKFLKSLRKN